MHLIHIQCTAATMEDDAAVRLHGYTSSHTNSMFYFSLLLIGKLVYTERLMP